MSVSNQVTLQPPALRLPESSFQPVAPTAARTQATQSTNLPTATGLPSTSSFSASAPAGSAVQLGGGVQQTGPLALESAPAQAAIQKTLAFLGQQNRSLAAASPSQSFSPRSVERDELGMTHVRMDRLHEGVPVFGEQVIGHLDRNGEVSRLTGELPAIPPGLGKEPVKLSSQEALAIAQKAFNGQIDSDRPPSAERVVFQGKDGQYHAAYHVKLDNVFDLQAGDRPRRMNYLVDANTGEMLTEYNQLGGIELPQDHTHEAGGAGEAHAASNTAHVTATSSPELTIPDRGSVSSSINITDDLDIQKLSLDLDISHTYRRDLRITLTSPSGKSAVVLDRQGGSEDDVKGRFDLSAFAGEPSKGEWKLTVQDKARLDEGTLHSWSLNLEGTPRQPPPPPPQGDDTTLYSGTVDLATSQHPDGNWELNDPTRGKGIATYNANGSTRPSIPITFRDSNNTWGEATDSPRTAGAIDAHFGAQMTYDFYKDVLGRDSIDNKGERLVSYVHVGSKFANAYWDGEKMAYGDGDGKLSGPLTTLDIAGHEISHGMTERTAGLIYEGESGGLNEAFSDIMGTGVEWYASQKNPGVKFDWSIAEDAWTPGKDGDALRYMDDPTKDGYSIDNYKDYPRQTEVHGSSGIANNAFYLLANGGKNRTSGIEVQDGIGMDKSLKIFYRALSTYMTPRTTFAQAREATLQAATDLYGANSVEVQRVKESWAAVGVS